MMLAAAADQEGNDGCVHSWAGSGRTGTVIGCYLKRHGIAGDADVISNLAQMPRGVPNGKEASPHAKEQVRMVSNWKKGV
jgi:protein-tyrosine phosphatase